MNNLRIKKEVVLIDAPLTHRCIRMLKFDRNEIYDFVKYLYLVVNIKEEK